VKAADLIADVLSRISNPDERRAVSLVFDRVSGGRLYFPDKRVRGRQVSRAVVLLGPMNRAEVVQSLVGQFGISRSTAHTRVNEAVERNCPEFRQKVAQMTSSLALIDQPENPRCPPQHPPS
jgi:hypothetical protein